MAKLEEKIEVSPESPTNGFLPLIGRPDFTAIDVKLLRLAKLKEAIRASDAEDAELAVIIAQINKELEKVKAPIEANLKEFIHILLFLHTYLFNLVTSGK